MRREDAERLSKEYVRSQQSGRSPLAAALGLPLPRVAQLFHTVFGDLDETALGVGWWSPHPGTARRILISDQLVCCLYDLDTNVVEAAIHYLEARGCAEGYSRRFVDAVRVHPSGGHTVVVPSPKSPAEEITERSVSMHVVGAVRALASALDCFAGATIGVMALPASILRADYKAVRTLLAKCEADACPAEQKAAATRLREVIARAGPTGWDDWVLGYRNMLVHRGRRLQLMKLVATGVALHDPRGPVIYPHEPVPVMPSDPERSDVEVFRDVSAKGFLLTESAWDTLGGAMKSVHDVLEEGCDVLRQLWEWRRSNPAALPQPRQQWPNIASGVSPFPGYSPNSLPFDPTEFRANPEFGRRLSAASLTDPARSRWPTFD
jgi:hypothetical protein